MVSHAAHPKRHSKTSPGAKTTSRSERRQVARHLDLLKLLQRARPDQAQTILPHLDEEAHQMLFKCCFNCLNHPKIIQNAKLKRRIKEKLSDKKDLIRYLSKNNIKLEKRRAKVPQLGGSLSLILSTVLPLLAEFVLPHLIKKFAKKN